MDASNNQLFDFTSYIESLCKYHIDINHTEDNKHFVELNEEQQLVDSKTLCYPLVTIDKLTVHYTGGDDFMNKSRYVELMFLNSTADAHDFKRIQEIKNGMERVAEDFLRKIKKDKRNRKIYPFLRNLSLSDVELDFVENSALRVYGALLSFNFELAFDETLEPGRFGEVES
ncbi:MAG: hypothetical protein PHU68_01240 [Paludibacter sp.]|nr:hypothetical protein [Paludibacter sp.]